MFTKNVIVVLKTLILACFQNLQFQFNSKLWNIRNTKPKKFVDPFLIYRELGFWYKFLQYKGKKLTKAYVTWMEQVLVKTWQTYLTWFLSTFWKSGCTFHWKFVPQRIFSNQKTFFKNFYSSKSSSVVFACV